MAPQWFVDHYIARFHRDQTLRPELCRAKYQAICDELWDWMYDHRTRIEAHFMYRAGEERLDHPERESQTKDLENFNGRST